MAEAYVLVNCDLGAEDEVIGGLKQIDHVKEVHGTFGAYDIIVKVQTESADKLREAITWNISHPFTFYFISDKADQAV